MNPVTDRAFLQHARPWLLAATLATILPHCLHQPYWLSGVALLLTAWSALLWRSAAPPPARWLLIVALVGICAGIAFQFRTLLGREAGVALLVGLMAMKQLEMRNRRDAHVAIMLGYFLLLTHYFYSQSLLTGAWLLLAFWVLTASLVGLSDRQIPPHEAIRESGRLCLQAIPFMLVLYLLFPRVTGPLWGLPADAHSARSGLSDRMAPGSISNLVQSGEIAFRVRFDDAPPAKHHLYWRGPVLEQFDGTTWRPAPAARSPLELTARSLAIRYETTLEASEQRWLLALDAPSGLPPETSLDGALTVRSTKALDSRRRFRLAAVLDYNFNPREDAAILSRNLQLPPQRNPKTRALAAQWRRDFSRPEQIAERALQLFRNENFVYTLRPPRLGIDSIDAFLFDTRRGFCEHYAAAFVVLMRSAGVPARVVGGYQGGERNPYDGYLVIRQSDAHAWAEIWVEGKGWLRVDPTAAVSPSRIEQGIGDALPVGEPLPAVVQLSGTWLRTLRHRWDALNNAWNQHVLGYDMRQQLDLLARLGLPDADWRTLAIALAAGCGVLLGLTAVWNLRLRRPVDPARRLWEKALRQLRRRKVDCPPWETPNALLQRLEKSDPALARRLSPVVDAYLHARYAPDGERRLDALRLGVSRLKSWRTD